MASSPEARRDGAPASSAQGGTSPSETTRSNTLYAVLQVLPSATMEEIVLSYRKLALLYHPDRPNGSHEKFQELQLAYEVLSSRDSRAKYDDLLKGKRALRNFKRPPTMTSVQQPVYVLLADGGFYEFEARASKLKCSFHYGDGIVFNNDRGSFIGLAGDGYLYWMVNGKGYATRLCEVGSTFALSSVRIVYRSNMGLQRAPLVRSSVASPTVRRPARTLSQGVMKDGEAIGEDVAKSNGGGGGEARGKGSHSNMSEAGRLKQILLNKERSRNATKRLEMIDEDEAEWRCDLEEECWEQLCIVHATAQAALDRVLRGIREPAGIVPEIKAPLLKDATQSPTGLCSPPLTSGTGNAGANTLNSTPLETDYNSSVKNEEVLHIASNDHFSNIAHTPEKKRVHSARRTTLSSPRTPSRAPWGTHYETETDKDAFHEGSPAASQSVSRFSSVRSEQTGVASSPLPHIVVPAVALESSLQPPSESPATRQQGKGGAVEEAHAGQPSNIRVHSLPVATSATATTCQPLTENPGRGGTHERDSLNLLHLAETNPDTAPACHTGKTGASPGLKSVPFSHSSSSSHALIPQSSLSIPSAGTTPLVAPAALGNDASLCPPLQLPSTATAVKPTSESTAMPKETHGDSVSRPHGSADRAASHRHQKNGFATPLSIHSSTAEVLTTDVQASVEAGMGDAPSLAEGSEATVHSIDTVTREKRSATVTPTAIQHTCTEPEHSYGDASSLLAPSTEALSPSHAGFSEETNAAMTREDGMAVAPTPHVVQGPGEGNYRGPVLLTQPLGFDAADGEASRTRASSSITSSSKGRRHYMLSTEAHARRVSALSQSSASTTRPDNASPPVNTHHQYENATADELFEEEVEFMKLFAKTRRVA